MSVTTAVIADDEADIRLDRWFRRHYPHITQGAVQKFCRTGQVRVEGKRVEASTRLEAGQMIRIPPLPSADAPRPRPPVDPAAARELEDMLLWRDEHVIVLNKPAGLAVQGGPGISRHLDAMLYAWESEGKRPLLVHRLDRDTTGVLVLARGPAVAARLAEAFRSRAVHKTYWAVVVGRPIPETGTIDLPLTRIGGTRGERTAVAERGDPEAAKAITDYRTLDHAARKLALLEMNPLTGRTHQLRVHTATMGTPILGDGKYGGEASYVEGLSEQMHLHARILDFPHPAGGRLVVEADLPAHMRETFGTLGFEVRPARKPRWVSGRD